MNIVELIPLGEQNAISRKELCRLVGTSDRRMRRIIAQLSRQYPICNLQNGKGYFLADNKEVANKMLRQEINRAKSIFLKIWGLRKYIES